MRCFKLFMYSFGLIVLLVISSCGKDKTLTKEKEVIARDLAGHYMAIESTLDGKPRYRLVYFVSDGGTVTATWDLPGSRRGGVVSLTNNIFSFDLNANGTDIYEFGFSGDAPGNIMLKSIAYKGTSNVQIQHAELYSNNAIPVWGGKMFKRVTGNIYDVYFGFTDDKLKYRSASVPPPSYSLDVGCYSIGSDVGFKNNNDNAMGIFVPSWKGNSDIKMLLTGINFNDGIATYKYN